MVQPAVRLLFAVGIDAAAIFGWWRVLTGRWRPLLFRPTLPADPPPP